MELKSYEWRTAARVLGDEDIQRVQQDVQLEIAMDQADIAGDEGKAIDLASKSVLRRRMAEEELPRPPIANGDGFQPLPDGDVLIEFFGDRHQH